jgi:hypothetical protein
MTDKELTLHIKHAGEQMQAAWADYEATGCLWARGQADRFRMEMERAISARSPAQVRSMELERGLAA